MRMIRSRISVIIPSYRAEATIGRAIDSVLAQPDVDPEIIVVVDGVFDRTAEIARSYSGVQILINETREGPQVTRNRGLQTATTPYVTFLDADDYVEGSLHGGMVRAFDQGNAEMVFASFASESVSPRRRVYSNLEMLQDDIGCNDRLICRLLTDTPLSRRRNLLAQRKSYSDRWMES
jgi:glycosyltransferase involved in cell wall biosynthesis